MKASTRLMAAGLLTFGLLTPQIGSAKPMRSVADLKVNLGAMNVPMLIAGEGVPRGGIAGGGGNMVNGQLFDFYENKGSQKIDLEEQPFFKNEVLPVIERIQKEIPEFKDFMTDAIVLKDWYIESKPIKNEPACLNPSSIEAKQEIAACQDRFQVRLSKRELVSASPQDRAYLIIHELIVAHGLEILNPQDRLIKWRRGDIPNENPNIRNGIYIMGPIEMQKVVRDLVRLLRDPLSTPRLLRGKFFDYSFATFMTKFEGELWAKGEARYRKFVCSISGAANFPGSDSETLRKDLTDLFAQCADGLRNRCETGMLSLSQGSSDDKSLVSYMATFASQWNSTPMSRLRIQVQRLSEIWGLPGAVDSFPQNREALEKILAAARRDYCTDFSGSTFSYRPSKELMKAYELLREQ